MVALGAIYIVKTSGVDPFNMILQRPRHNTTVFDHRPVTMDEASGIILDPEKILHR